MNTREFVHARLKAVLPVGDPVPPFTAVQIATFEAIDRLAGIAVKQPIMKTHEYDVMKMKHIL